MTLNILREVKLLKHIGPDAKTLKSLAFMFNAVFKFYTVDS